MDVDVDEHALKHGLVETEIKFAWEHRIKMRHRPVPNEQFAVAVGCVPDGGLIQMVAVQNDRGYLIFHAMAPPQKRVLDELGMGR